MANECIPLYDDGDNVTFLASVAVTGKKFVEISTAGFDTNSNCLQAVLPTVGGNVIGIASFDAPIGGLFNVRRVGNPLIVPATAGATVTAGQMLQVDATGAVVPLVTTVPGAPTITLGTAAAGGTFAAGAYFWKVTTLIAGGIESVGSNEVTATLSLNQQQPINWSAVTGATGYRVYRGVAAGAENVLVATLGTVVTYTDTGIAGTAATTPPATAPVAGIVVARAVTGGTVGADVYVSLDAN